MSSPSHDINNVLDGTLCRADLPVISPFECLAAGSCAFFVLAPSAALAQAYPTPMIAILPHRGGRAEHSVDRSLRVNAKLVSRWFRAGAGSAWSGPGRGRRPAERFAAVDKGHERRSGAARGRAGALPGASNGLALGGLTGSPLPSGQARSVRAAGPTRRYAVRDIEGGHRAPRTRAR